jgi:hypothetical protein
MMRRKRLLLRQKGSENLQSHSNLSFEATALNLSMLALKPTMKRFRVKTRFALPVQTDTQ